MDISTIILVHPSVARVCVEINLLEPLQTKIGLGFGTEVIIQPVIYERLPKYCGTCKHLGHNEDEFYEKHKTKAMARPVERDDHRTPAPDRGDLRVKLSTRCKDKCVAFKDSEARSNPGASTSGWGRDA
ncbi:UNVERIFIED_CONTAM: hypothetical protein Sangu_1549400 [Sesamum angustifolium]|uniref:Zinc knuckle CX2CX4HX4C domain-containing protein n=1 Tax=Sesamum angustifolium TaxID=2727405 RepID=A0AAW2MQM0_9LAMI